MTKLNLAFRNLLNVISQVIICVLGFNADLFTVSSFKRMVKDVNAVFAEPKSTLPMPLESIQKSDSPGHPLLIDGTVQQPWWPINKTFLCGRESVLNVS